MPQPPSRPNTTVELSPAAIPPAAARLQIPAWLMSFLLHFCVFTACAYFIRDKPRGIAGVEPGKEAGIVLVSSTQGKSSYLDQNEAASGDAADSASNSASAAVSSPFPDAIALPSPGPVLPTKQGATSIGGLPTGIPDSIGFTKGGGSPGGKGDGKGSTQLQVFGVRGNGSKFIYVFDRSASMEGRPLAAAKRELIASLESLDKIHQFQIIFYNQEPRLMQLRPGLAPSMEFGNEQGKKNAEIFVGSILADGGTRHMEALELALSLKPDVIFFLTDADDPMLSASELARIRRLNDSASINTIEFGSGPARGGYNFLKRLAEENRGKYGYVDASRL